MGKEAEGYIERWEQKTAWGSLDNGKTFDIPLEPNKYHMVGDKVVFGSNDGEPIEEEYSFLVMGSLYATILYANASDEGYEITCGYVINKDGETIETFTVSVPH